MRFGNEARIGLCLTGMTLSVAIGWLELCSSDDKTVPLGAPIAQVGLTFMGMRAVCLEWGSLWRQYYRSVVRPRENPHPKTNERGTAGEMGGALERSTLWRHAFLRIAPLAIRVRETMAAHPVGIEPGSAPRSTPHEKVCLLRVLDLVGQVLPEGSGDLRNFYVKGQSISTPETHLPSSLLVPI